MEVKSRVVTIGGIEFDIVISFDGGADTCEVMVYMGKVLVEKLECSMPVRVRERNRFFERLLSRVPFILRRRVFPSGTEVQGLEAVDRKSVV